LCQLVDHPDANAAAGELGGGDQASGSGADDYDIGVWVGVHRHLLDFSRLVEIMSLTLR
jgi:hypothetical protein